jgi:hypothetical protein
LATATSALLTPIMIVIAGKDGVTYSISPKVFLVSEGDNVIYLHLTGASPRSKGLGFDLAEIVFERMK